MEAYTYTYGQLASTHIYAQTHSHLTLCTTTSKPHSVTVQELAEKFLGWNVTKWGLFIKIVSFAVHILLPSVLQCLDPMGQKVINSKYDVIIWTFQPMNFSFDELFSPWTLQPINFSVYELFSLWTIQSMKCLVYELFSPWTLQPMNFSAYEFFSLWTFQSINFSVHELFSPWTFQPMNFSAHPCIVMDCHTGQWCVGWCDEELSF